MCSTINNNSNDRTLKPDCPLKNPKPECALKNIL